MEIQKYSDFIINEARVKKEEIIDKLLDLFKKKPHVEMDRLSNEKGLYSLSGMKKYLSNYTTLQVDQALHDIRNDKSIDLKVIRVFINVWDESIPYYYMDLTEAEAKKIKSEYEEQEMKKNKEEIDKTAERRKVQKAATGAKLAAKKEETAKKAAGRKKAAPKKKASGEGVERAPRTRKKTSK
jgi:hypothetical protein